METIQVLPFRVSSAALNMAMDEWMLKSEGMLLRVYGWKPSALSFGRNQSKFPEIDFEFCRKNNVESVKRLTGGRTVFHHKELTYAIASDSIDFSDSVIKTYQAISEVLCDFLKQLGIEPEMKKKRNREDPSSVCFKQVSNYEITVNGKKLIGSAQFRNSKRFLQHGSIPLSLDWETWYAIWHRSEDQNGMKERITCLEEVVDTLRPEKEIADRLIQSFQNVLGSDIRNLEWTEEEFQAIEQRAAEYHPLF